MWLCRCLDGCVGLCDVAVLWGGGGGVGSLLAGGGGGVGGREGSSEYSGKRRSVGRTGGDWSGVVWSSMDGAGVVVSGCHSGICSGRMRGLI